MNTINRGVSGSEKSNETDDPNQSKPEKKNDFYGSDKKPNRTNRKPKWFGSVLGSNFQIQWINRTKPIYSIYVKLFF
jgi:hypothetical protein